MTPATLTNTHTQTHTHNLLKHDNKVDFVPAGFSFTAQHNAASLPTPTPAQTHNHPQLLIGYYLGCRSLCWYLMKGHGCHFSADGHQGNRSVGGKGGTGEGGFVGGLLQGVRNKGREQELVQCRIRFDLVVFGHCSGTQTNHFRPHQKEQKSLLNMFHIYWKALSFPDPSAVSGVRLTGDSRCHPVSADLSKVLKTALSTSFYFQLCQISNWQMIRGARQKEADVYILKTHMFWNCLDAGWCEHYSSNTGLDLKTLNTETETVYSASSFSFLGRFFFSLVSEFLSVS